jgi:hypothetical protein
MSRFALLIMTMLTTALAFAIPASASAANVHRVNQAGHGHSTGTRTSTGNFICNPTSGSNPSLCLRDPSDGGAGTPVKMSVPNFVLSDEWVPVQDKSACNGTGTVESGCGLPAFLVDRYGGDSIKYIQQVSSHDCIKFSSATGWFGEMGTCGDNVTLLIKATCSNSFCFYPAIAASEAFNSIQWMCGASSGQQPFTSGSCPAGTSTWCECTMLGSPLKHLARSPASARLTRR